MRARVDARDAARIALAVRTAPRVVLELSEPLPAEPAALAAGLRRMAWERHLPAGLSWAVRSVGRSARFRHTGYTSRWVKDQIRARFAAVRAVAPPVDSRAPDVLVDLRLMNESAHVGLHLGRGSLHRRAVPRHAAAPLREDVAAGLAWLADVHHNRPMVDPFCGSGTLIAEAVAVARRVPPDRDLALLARLAVFADVNLEWIARELVDDALPMTAPVIAADRDRTSIEQTRDRLRRMRLADVVDVQQSN
ncbi:MAG: hypothetical protein JSV80_01825, partial [Acidobacteriota bacterium]